MKDKNKRASPSNSDVPQSQVDTLHAVKRASILSNALSESKAKQPQTPEPPLVEAEGAPEKSEVAAPTANKPAEGSVAVPRFNLAERILAEQRRSASGRRRKAGPGGAAAGSYAADDTLGAVIREVKDNMARPVEAADGDNPAVCETGGETAEATAQKQLIADIVAREITALCSRRLRDSLNR